MPVLTPEQKAANIKASKARWRDNNRAKTRADAKAHAEANRERRNAQRRALYARKKGGVAVRAYTHYVVADV